MGILDAMRKHAEKNVPDFVRYHDIFKYEGEYYIRREYYLHSTRSENRIEIEKLNKNRCNTTCDEHQWTKMDLNKVQELTIDDYKKLANEKWFHAGKAMAQMCSNQIGCGFTSSYSIHGKTIGSVTFIERDTDSWHYTETLVIHCGEVVAVDRNFNSIGIFGCDRSIDYTLSSAIGKYMGWDYFIDGIYNGDIIKNADVTSLNIKDAVDRWNIAQFKKSEATLQETLERLYSYQRELNIILENQEISPTRHIATYKDMIMFINSIKLYENILKPDFNMTMLKESQYQNQLVDWIEG